jgi:hypothetical protein
LVSATGAFNEPPLTMMIRGKGAVDRRSKRQQKRGDHQTREKGLAWLHWSLLE